MSEQHPVLVVGATGRQGGATARHLLAAGRPVRALVRDPAAPAARELAAAGAELVTGDLDRPETLGPAAAGVRAVFAVTPNPVGPATDRESEESRGLAVLEAARRAGADQIVFTSIASFAETTDEPVAVGKRVIEEAVIASGLRYTLLRPVRFMENYLARDTPIDGIVDGVHRHVFDPEGPMQVIAVDDIGAIAAAALTDPDRFHGRVLELAGDELTPVAAAAAIAAATGHPVRYHQLTDDELGPLGPLIASVLALVRGGARWHADIPALRAIHPGLRTFDAWLAETGAAQLKSLLARR
ncbi:NmrA family NAD(P)-binding protein [Nocardia sp. NPDC004068]|uniref:NmrA family NAD(P)-binding protein n=1 Tax=Nocardia sp. NPDC004068 TaxID=3364303 RepID=UPI00369ABAF6